MPLSDLTFEVPWTRPYIAWFRCPEDPEWVPIPLEAATFIYNLLRYVPRRAEGWQLCVCECPEESPDKP
jgi:hypothetical protein